MVESLIELPALREISLVGQRLTDDGLGRLLRGHQFTGLSIHMDTRLTAAGLAALAAQVGLARLAVSSRESALTDEALANVSRVSSLERLSLESKVLTSDGLRHLAELRSLEYLELRIRDVTDDVLAPLADLTSLTTLHVGWSDKFSGDGLRHLSGLRNLRTLNLGSLSIDDEALVHLASLTDLEELRLALHPPRGARLASSRWADET